jgi:hypothetical protein
MNPNKTRQIVPPNLLDILAHCGCKMADSHRHVSRSDVHDAARMLVTMTFGLQKARHSFLFQGRAAKIVLKRTFAKYVNVERVFTKPVVSTLLSRNRTLADAVMLAKRMANNSRQPIYARYDALDVLEECKVGDDNIRRLFGQKDVIVNSL